MGFSNLDQVMASLPGQQQSIIKGNSLSVGSPGNWRGLWHDLGSFTGSVSEITSATQGGVYYVSSHNGAWRYDNPNSVSAESCVIGKVSAWSRMPGDVMFVYDRAWACRGVHANTTATFNVASIAFVRSFDAAKAELWMWINAPIGNTLANLTVSYIDANGTAKTVTALPRPFTGSLYQFIETRIFNVTSGIQRVTSGALSAGTGAAGEFGFIIRVPKLYLPINAGLATNYDALATGLVTVASNEALELVYQSNTVNFGSCGAMLHLITR